MKNTEYRISHYNTCKWPRGIIVNHVKHNKPCKNTTQAGTNHKILLNSFFYTKILTFITFFFTKNTFSLSFYFPNCTILKYDKNTRIRVQYSSIFFVRVLWTILSPSSNDPPLNLWNSNLCRCTESETDDVMCDASHEARSCRWEII